MTAQAHLMSWNCNKLAALYTKLARQAAAHGRTIDAATMQRRAESYQAKAARWAEVA